MSENCISEHWNLIKSIVKRLKEEAVVYDEYAERHPEIRIYDMRNCWVRAMFESFCVAKIVDETRYTLYLPFFDKDLKRIEIEISASGFLHSKIEMRYYKNDLTVEKIPENVDKILRNMFVNIDLEKGVVFIKTTYDYFEVAFTNFLQAVILISNL